VVGSALGCWLRSSVAALTDGLVAALFENMIDAVAPFGKGLLPASALATVASSGSNGNPYGPSLVAALVFAVVVVVGSLALVSSRDVSD